MKNKYTYVWVSFVILIFGIIFIPKIVNRIKEGSVVENDRMNRKDNSGELAYIINEQGMKRRVPNFAFVNQDSLMITDKDYSGKVYVVEFFFTTCPTICPIMNENLVKIQNEFKEFNDFGVASFTINPKHDTPRVLKEYAERYGITNIDWHLMTGAQEDIYELANKGFYILANEASDAPGGFEHSGRFALIDKKGFIRSRVDNFGNPIIYYRGTITEEQGVNLEGEEQEISMLKEDIKKLLAE
ncbi:SCO family protein [Spongiimicrobium salis]|uniref:SCO family protein n=1 Tax=Spongiimicrobium salis TaxID=1667022 RepID=UPI00374D1AC5